MMNSFEIQCLKDNFFRKGFPISTLVSELGLLMTTMVSEICVSIVQIISSDREKRDLLTQVHCTVIEDTHKHKINVFVWKKLDILV